MTVTVYYWGPSEQAPFYGRGIGIYAALNQAGVEYDVKGIADLPANASFAMPCIDLDGLVVGQGPAILMAIGAKYNLAGASAEETARVHQAVLDFNDVMGESKTFAEKPERAQKWLAYLNAKIEASSTGWVAGTPEATVGDFHGVFALEWMTMKKVDCTTDYPAIQAWFDKVKEVPGVKKLYDSDKAMVPSM